MNEDERTRTEQLIAEFQELDIEIVAAMENKGRMTQKEYRTESVRLQNRANTIYALYADMITCGPPPQTCGLENAMTSHGAQN